MHDQSARMAMLPLSICLPPASSAGYSTALDASCHPFETRLLLRLALLPLASSNYYSKVTSFLIKFRHILLDPLTSTASLQCRFQKGPALIMRVKLLGSRDPPMGTLLCRHGSFSNATTRQGHASTASRLILRAGASLLWLGNPVRSASTA